MIVGICEISLLIRESQSLKDRRRVLNGLKARLRDRFNISVSEVGSQDNWKRSVLGLATVASTKRFANQVLSKAIQFAESDPRIEILDHRMEIY